MTVMRYLLPLLLCACVDPVEFPDPGVYVVQLDRVAHYGPCEGFETTRLVYDLTEQTPQIQLANDWECARYADVVSCSIWVQVDVAPLVVDVNFATLTGYSSYDSGACRSWYDVSITADVTPLEQSKVD